MASFDSVPAQVAVKLDGVPIEIPPERRSFSAIRSYLEWIALRQQRLLCWITVDGAAVNLTQSPGMVTEFSQLEGETISLAEVPAQLIRGALHQATAVRARVQTAVELVLINDAQTGRELWWTLSSALKEPLVTLSLLPETICGPDNGRASLIQLRKWQLQQLACVIQDIDEAARSEESTVLSDALEKRALPWLDKLQESLTLWNETVTYGAARTQCQEV